MTRPAVFNCMIPSPPLHPSFLKNSVDALEIYLLYKFSFYLILKAIYTAAGKYAMCGGVCGAFFKRAPYPFYQLLYFFNAEHLVTVYSYSLCLSYALLNGFLSIW